MAVVYRRLRILTPSLGAYYGVVDEEYRPHELASRWPEVRFFGRAQAETTSAQYAGSIALFLTWSRQSGRDLEQAARNLHLFAAYLATEPLTSGRNADSPRTAGRANRILVAVREFYRFAITEGALPARLFSDLYKLPDEREFHPASGPRVRHRRREPRRATAPDQATAAEVTALLDAATTARDRFLILLFALTGMRIGQALGLRRQDLHLVPDAAGLGLPSPTGGSGLCRVPGEHIHVVRRRNPNGAWSKAQFDFAVPAQGNLLALYDSCGDGTAGRMNALARYGLAGKASALQGLSGPRRGATLLCAVRALTSEVADDLCDALDAIVAERVVRKAARESTAARLKSLPRLSRASLQGRLACGLLCRMCDSCHPQRSLVSA